jgi:hypothetical protein
MVGAAEDDLKILIAKRFVLIFQSGVLVIKHWRMHNYIQNDRYKPTVYQDEKAMLVIKPNKAYTQKSVHSMDAECMQDVSTLDAQIRLDKISIDKNSLDKDTGAGKPPKHQYGEYKNVLLTDDELEKWQSERADWAQRIETLSEYIASKGASYKSHLATMRSWARKDDAKNKPMREGSYD